jgi:hypothetical protein
VTISITAIGTGTTSISIGAGGVPAGSQIVLCCCDDGNGSIAQATVTDTAGNTYVSVTGSTLAAPYVDIIRARTGLALVNGNTITYTRSSGGTHSNIEAFYATGLANVVAQAQATNSGIAGASPTVTSGTPNDVGFLFVGVVGGSAAISSFTQDSTNAAWGSPPGQVSIALPPLGGGTVINSNKSALTYNPAFGTPTNWGAVITALRGEFTDMTSRALMMS